MSDRGVEALCERKNSDNEKNSIKFSCPICCSNGFKEEYESNGIIGPGHRSWRKHCICSGCSVIFKDPEKFSKKLAF